MQIGTQTTNVINHLYSRMTVNAPEPRVGMAATTLSWSDRNGATVIAIDKNIVTVQQDIATRVDTNGLSEDQEYEFQANPNGYVQHFRMSKEGTFTEVRKNSTTGRWNKADTSSGLILGFRRHYHDFSF